MFKCTRSIYQNDRILFERIGERIMEEIEKIKLTKSIVEIQNKIINYDRNSAIELIKKWEKIIKERNKLHMF